MQWALARAVPRRVLIPIPSMCTGAQVRREGVGARRGFRHLWGREATDLVRIRACACRHWRRYRVERVRWRLLWEAWSRAIAWIHRGRYMWSRFAECRAEMICGGGTSRSMARRTRTGHCRLSMKGSRTTAGYLD